MSKNGNLHKAKSGKNDEFYTQLKDIEDELRHYKHHFKDKVVYCNCDDPQVSNFFKYFSLNFEHLGLKKLISSCYRNTDADKRTKGLTEKAVWLEYKGEHNGGPVPTPDNIGVHEFEGDGDFRSEESIDLLKQADIIVTNPPFSLFREYIAQLIGHDKKFLVVGNVNALTFSETFPLIKNNQMWLGHNTTRHFLQPDGTLYETARTFWYTNLDFAKRHEDLILYREYSGIDYPKFDNYDAINVDKTTDIPMDYAGVMGVPITFLDKYNPEQFEIISSNDVRLHDKVPFKEHGLIKDKDGAINGKPKYARILIKNKKVVKP